jgi:hypothetical protein
MKDAVITVLIVVVAWLAWSYFHNPPQPSNPKGSSLVAQDKYGPPLRAVSVSVFSPLDSKPPNPVAEIARLSAMAEADAGNGSIKPEEGKVIKNLCSILLEANQAREKFVGREAEIMNKNYSSFDGESGAAQTRRFYLTSNQNDWSEYCRNKRKTILVTLDKLPGSEKPSEADKRVDPVPTDMK